MLAPVAAPAAAPRTRAVKARKRAVSAEDKQAATKRRLEVAAQQTSPSTSSAVIRCHLAVPSRLTIGSDFSGWESFIQAMELLKVPFKHIFSCDRDPSVTKLIQACFAPVIMYNDITLRDPKCVPYVDTLVTSPLCQDFASGGSNAGGGGCRGRLLGGSMDYVAMRRPRAILLENVKNLVQQHRGTFDGLVKQIEHLGYVVFWEIIRSSDHGVPQIRDRVYLVAFRLDSYAHDFSFPMPLKKCLPLDAVLDPPQQSDRPGALPENGQASQNVTTAYAEVREHYNCDPAKTSVIVDMLASSSHFTYQLDRCMTITATRASPSGYWVSTRGRPMTLDEMARLFGTNLHRIRACRGSISDRRLGHIIGNSISVNVLSRIIPNLLKSAGLYKGTVDDPWLKL